MTPGWQWPRLKRRLIRHHLGLAVFSTALTLGFYFLTFVSAPPWAPRAEPWHWSMATAYAGLALLGATLLLGPLKVLRRRSNPLSNDLRRDMGYWTALLFVVHVVLGLHIHNKSHEFIAGIVFSFFKATGASGHLVPRLDWFGLANYLGLAATVLVVVLAGISNDYALRRIGPARWKSLQRWSYGLFALVLVHGVLFQILEKRQDPYIVLFAEMCILIMVVQYLGFRRKKRKAAR